MSALRAERPRSRLVVLDLDHTLLHAKVGAEAAGGPPCPHPDVWLPEPARPAIGRGSPVRVAARSSTATSGGPINHRPPLATPTTTLPSPSSDGVGAAAPPPWGYAYVRPGALEWVERLRGTPRVTVALWSAGGCSVGSSPSYHTDATAVTRGRPASPDHSKSLAQQLARGWKIPSPVRVLNDGDTPHTWWPDRRRAGGSLPAGPSCRPRASVGASGGHRQLLKSGDVGVLLVRLNRLLDGRRLCPTDGQRLRTAMQYDDTTEEAV